MDEFLQYLEGMDDPLLTATNKIKELLQENESLKRERDEQSKLQERSDYMLNSALGQVGVYKKIAADQEAELEKHATDRVKQRATIAELKQD